MHNFQFIGKQFTLNNIFVNIVVNVCKLSFIQGCVMRKRPPWQAALTIEMNLLKSSIYMTVWWRTNHFYWPTIYS